MEKFITYFEDLLCCLQFFCLLFAQTVLLRQPALHPPTAVTTA